MSRVVQIIRQALAIGAIVAVSGLLGSCGDTHPLYGPGSPRNVKGTAVDPITGIPLPGAPEGNAGM